jgi:hypothetical protein
MPTFRDDLAKVGKRILETVEERTGREVISTEERQLLESDRSERRHRVPLVELSAGDAGVAVRG